MSWDAVGKSAKRDGKVHYRDVRKADPNPVPPKIPGKATPSKKARKVFGYSYQVRTKEPGSKWRTVKHHTWYATEKQRDDAMRSAGGYYKGSYNEIRNVKPILRNTKP